MWLLTFRSGSRKKLNNCCESIFYLFIYLQSTLWVGKLKHRKKLFVCSEKLIRKLKFPSLLRCTLYTVHCTLYTVHCTQVRVWVFLNLESGTGKIILKLNGSGSATPKTAKKNQHSTDILCIQSPGYSIVNSDQRTGRRVSGRVAGALFLVHRIPAFFLWPWVSL